MCQGSAHPHSHEHRCPPRSPLWVPAHRQSCGCQSLAQAPAWARLRLCRSRLSRRGCGSCSLSSSDTVTPAAGAHTICSHSSCSCPQTARGAALLPSAGAAVCRQSRGTPASPAGDQRWGRRGRRGLDRQGQKLQTRLEATWGDDAGNISSTGRRHWKRRQHWGGMHEQPTLTRLCHEPGNVGQGGKTWP